MQDPANLSHAQLAGIVRNIQDALHKNGDVYDYSRGRDAPAVLRKIDVMFREHDLRPTSVADYREPVLGRLFTLRVKSEDELSYEKTRRLIKRVLGSGYAEAERSKNLGSEDRDLDHVLGLTWEVVRDEVTDVV